MRNDDAVDFVKSSLNSKAEVYMRQARIRLCCEMIEQDQEWVQRLLNMPIASVDTVRTVLIRDGVIQYNRDSVLNMTKAHGEDIGPLADQIKKAVDRLTSPAILDN